MSIERDDITIRRSIWSQLQTAQDLKHLTIDDAGHIVDLCAQLIRWREQEIAQSLVESGKVGG